MITDSTYYPGQDATPASVSAFFPPSTPQIIPLPTYLSTLSSLLAPLSSTVELQNAFAAFDDDDSGQVDVAELKDALLHTAPEVGSGERLMSAVEVDSVLKGFVEKRAFGTGMGHKGAVGGEKRGQVLKYNDFIGSIMGGSGVSANGHDDGRK